MVNMSGRGDKDLFILAHAWTRRTGLPFLARGGCPMSTQAAARIMAHMVAFYPDRRGSLEVARGLVDGGCAYLELQFPFSDPTADGPDIQRGVQRRPGRRVHGRSPASSSLRRSAAP